MKWLACSVAAGFLAFLAPGVAIADTLCGSASGQVCCNDEKSLPVLNTYWSQWQRNGTIDYNAIRRNSGGSVTYFHRVNGGGFWLFENSIDVPRSTALQHLGSPSYYYEMFAYTKTSCFT